MKYEFIKTNLIVYDTCRLLSLIDNVTWYMRLIMKIWIIWLR